MERSEAVAAVARRPPILRPLVICVVGLVLALSIALRFWTTSPLWLDEALTVNISREPLSRIPALLRHDGAPPLYYFMLHFWMELFGQGDLATRSLAGIIGVINLPVAWITGYRVGSRWWSPKPAEEELRRRQLAGRVTAWSVTLLLAVSPFAVYYDTEARMYAFVLLLGTLGVLVVCSILRRPTWLNTLALAVVTSAALYSHYWSLYLGAVSGIAALFFAVHGPHRREARHVVAGLVIGALTFLPWLPTFVFQAEHTGTPWSTPVAYTAIVTAFTQLAGGTSTEARGLTLVFFFLLVLALLGAAVDRRHVMLDLRTRPGVRLVAAAAVGTLVLAVLVAKVQGSAFADRYTSIVAFPMLLAVAYGLTAIADVRIRYGVLGVAIALGLAASVANVTILRTQAGQAATAITASSSRGDVVAYCPDQLGPSVSRLLPAGRYRQVTFPRFAAPQIVNWVNYDKVIAAASPTAFARHVEQLAGSHTIFYVWSPAYLGFGNDCAEIDAEFASYRTQHNIVALQADQGPLEIFEGMSVNRFGPK
jgi:mannosyltransferase